MPEKLHAVLALANGKIFTGTGLGAIGSARGELVFNTAMTGYQEILTDPSYRQQVVLLTYPHIGNTGINDEDYESDSMQAEGLVLRDYSPIYSNYRAQTSLEQFLQKHGKSAIYNIDTRALTRLLRDTGSQNCCLRVYEHNDHTREAELALSEARAFAGLENADLAAAASCSDAHHYQQSAWRLGSGFGNNSDGNLVAVIDYGTKRNILRLLNARGLRVLVLPASSDIAAVRASSAAGVVLSNGPGDPKSCAYAIELARSLLAERIPTLGICLGHQILGLALGARTMKMKHGHHGANHPVQEQAGGKVFISSQNHGFCLSDKDLPEHISITHRSLFDNSIQGLRSAAYPALSFQGHPEANPGPVEMEQLFDDFAALLNSNN